MSVFTGSAVALVTPFKENGEVNHKKLEDLVNFQIENKTDAIVICGTTGESATQSEQQHLETIAECVEYVKKRIPVIAGTGSNDTSTAVYLTTEAEKAGADAALLVTPYYNKATQKGLIAHFSTVAAETSLPIILYNVPSRTGCNILPETVVELMKVSPNVVGIKEACGNISQIAKLASIAGDGLDIYSGNDEQVTPIMALGGKGVISVLANVAPVETHDMVMAYLEGDVKKAADIQLRAVELIDALFCEVNPIPVKAALNIMGWDVGIPRLPLTEMEPANQERLKKALAGFGII